jgi:4,5-dihydroxyphthalate decarboxylase
MSNLSLSLAISHYDHVQDLVTGRVSPEGIDLNSMQLPVEEIFFRMFHFEEWDIAEFSMAKYVALVDSGNPPFRAIPVFPSRVFRQSAFYVAANRNIRGPQDLAGKRIGVPEWAQTAGIYARAFLQHQCGVHLADIEWLQAGVNQPGRNEKVTPSLTDGIAIQYIHDRCLNEMLLAGDLDAIISAREPAAFAAGDSRIARLWPDYQPVEEAYFQETGIFPIMHVIVIRNEVLDRHRWVPMNLLSAFEEAKRNSLQRLSSIVRSSIPVPWSQEAYHRARRLFGPNLWPYGVEPNRLVLESFLRYASEQGVTRRILTLDELFPREVTQYFKV